MKTNLVKITALLVLATACVSAQPSESAIQTAIAQTQTAQTAVAIKGVSTPIATSVLSPTPASAVTTVPSAAAETFPPTVTAAAFTTEQPTTVLPAPAFRLIPLDIRVVSTGSGWAEYEFSLAIENQGTLPIEYDSTLFLGNSEIETQEGFTYYIERLNGSRTSSLSERKL